MNENWENDFEWLRVRHFIKDRFNKDSLPDLNTVLLMIGIQEAGIVKPTYSKEEKQDLMHVAVCELLTKEGYFDFVGRDEDGWPHYKTLKPFETSGVEQQEAYLVKCVVEYFKEVINN